MAEQPRIYKVEDIGNQTKTSLRCSESSCEFSTLPCRSSKVARSLLKVHMDFEHSDLVVEADDMEEIYEPPETLASRGSGLPMMGIRPNATLRCVDPACDYSTEPCESYESAYGILNLHMSYMHQKQPREREMLKLRFQIMHAPPGEEIEVQLNKEQVDPNDTYKLSEVIAQLSKLFKNSGGSKQDPNKDDKTQEGHSGDTTKLSGNNGAEDTQRKLVEPEKADALVEILEHSKSGTQTLGQIGVREAGVVEAKEEIGAPAWPFVEGKKKASNKEGGVTVCSLPKGLA